MACCHAQHGLACNVIRVRQGLGYMLTAEQEQKLQTQMAAAQKGDKHAYSELLTTLTRFFSDFLLRKVPPRDRDDVVQDILLSLHKARHTYTPDRPFMPWVMAIARYRLHDHWRLHYRHDALNTGNIDDVAENFGQDVTETYEISEDVRRAMKGLNEKQKQVVAQMYGQDLNVQEVADNLKMSVSAVKVTAHRAYKVLRGKLGDHR
ncbi:MAG: sigma-70 family RNA polymerase sigma factor [Alphaproteobacteria bacterium]|nr:sigma-70 family RNA polymerase sigma factor [Alphaproteobacteria bacterium]